jgi:arsenate reductase
MPADRVYNVLFLCTGNSARSVMGEALINAMGEGRFQGYSAGSHPKGEVHPMTLTVLGEDGLDTTDLRSKSWDEFATPDAPQMDFVFTVCDDAAGEACPLWPGQPITAHWGIEDPARTQGSELIRLAAFEAALKYMRNRIAAFVALPIRSIDAMTLQARLRGIGALPGSSAKAGDAA